MTIRIWDAKAVVPDPGVDVFAYDSRRSKWVVSQCANGVWFSEEPHPTITHWFAQPSDPTWKTR